jgi:flagellar biosynthesis chaperone FliJ
VSARIRRVERLLELGKDALKVARSSAAAATLAAGAAREIALRDEQMWSDTAARFGTGVSRVSDLDEQAAHLRTLRLRADDGARRLQAALAEERRCAAAVIKAATDQKKLEMLRDRILQAAREEDDRQERRASDELAARTVRSRP